MMMDIKRICQQPDEEDKLWFPDIAGSDWHKTLDFAMRNFKDESFIAQYLSPKLIRELKLFSIWDDDKKEHLEIKSIHDEAGYQDIRQQLASQYNLSEREPNIQIKRVDLRGDRSLYLEHIQHKRKPLSDDVEEVLRHLHRLWGFDIHLDSLDDGNITASYHCTGPSE